MTALLRFTTIVLVLFIMPKISPYRISARSFEPYLQDEVEPYASDTEYNRQINSMLFDEGEDAKINFKETKHRSEKRNGDLINFLLGLPKGMLDAGR